MHLIRAILLRGFLLVEALKGAVVAFIETPAATYGYPRKPHLLECNVGRRDRPHQQAGVYDIAVDALVGHECASEFRFCFTRV